MRLLKIAIYTSATILNCAIANPALDDILQYDVLLTAEYKIKEGKGEFIIRNMLKGEISDKINERLSFPPNMKFKNRKVYIFYFWKNGDRNYGAIGLDWNKYYDREVNGKEWRVTIQDIDNALKKNP